MWKEIIGHAQQIGRLQRALDSRTLAQAYLFTGPRGVGKALVARTLAATVIRRCAKDLDSSPMAQNDNRIEREQHPDIMWLRVLPDKSEISLEQWRAVEAKVQFQALEGERKFIIIDDAEKMSASVANACLKTLEEPPTNTHFILVAHDADRLLPTIRSRCQHLVFGPLPEAAVTDWLVAQGVDSKMTQRASQLSQGSFQRARLLADAETLAMLDVLVRDVTVGLTPRQVLTHAATLATTEALPELLDGMAVSLRNDAVHSPSHKNFQRIQTLEQASHFISMKGANKELILNEMFINLLPLG